MGIIHNIKSLFTRKPEGWAQALIDGVHIQTQNTAPKRGISDYLEAYSTHSWLRAAEAVIADGVASVQWKIYAVRKGNKLAQPGKIMTLDKAMAGGGKWYRNRALQQASKHYRNKYINQCKQTGELVEIEEHPMLDSLYNMNPYFTGYQTRKLVTIFLDIAGEAFLLKERNSMGDVIGLWPVPSHWVKNTPLPTFPFYVVQWGNSRNSSNVPESEILWMVDPDPYNPYSRGSGHWMAAGDELDLSEFMMKYQKAFFHNMARPDFIVEMDGLSSDQTRRFEQGWNAQHQGFWRAFKAHFINRKTQIHQIQGSFKDQQLAEITDKVRDHLAQIIGLPPEKLGIIESSNRATSEAADLTFTKDVVVPRAEFQRQYYQEKLLPEYDDRLILDFESPIPADALQELDAAKSQPHVLTVNEWRELTGHGALPDAEGEVHIIQGQPKVIASFEDLAEMQKEDRELARYQFGFGDSNNEEPMDETVSEEEEQESEEDGKDDDKWIEPEWVTTHKDCVPLTHQGEVLMHIMRGDTEERASRSFRSPSFPGKVFPKGTVCSKTLFTDSEDVPDEVEYTDVHRIADRFYGPVKQNIILNLNRVKDAIDMTELERLLSMQESAESVMATIPLSILHGLKAYEEPQSRSALKAFLKSFLAKIAGLSAEAAAYRLATALREDVRFTNLDQNAVAWAAMYAANLVRNVSAATREAIKDVIIQAYEQSWHPYESARIIKNIVGLDPRRSKAVVKYWKGLVDSGLDPDAIAKRVEKYAGAQIAARAKTIARTETINASNMGQQIAWDRAVADGVIDKDAARKIWIITPDDRLDTIICEPMPTMDENQDVPIDGQFTTGDGRLITRPTAHPNCRCTTGLVMKKY